MPCGQENKMTDDNTKAAPEDNQEVVAPVVDVNKLQKDLEAMAARVAAVDKKNQELLDEKKKVTEAKRLADEELEKEKLRKSGDVDKLIEIERNKTQQALNDKAELLKEIKQKEVAALASAMADEMRGRPESKEILINCVVKEISSLVDEKGNLSDVQRAVVVQNFIESSKYKPLILGNLSTGGGAEGSGGSATLVFNTMTEAEQVQLFKSNPEKWRQLKAASVGK